MRTVRVYDVDQETGAETERGDFPLLDFVVENEMSIEDDEAINGMEPGERHYIGGGASPLVYVTRLT